MFSQPFKFEIETTRKNPNCNAVPSGRCMRITRNYLCFAAAVFLAQNYDSAISHKICDVHSSMVRQKRIRIAMRFFFEAKLFLNLCKSLEYSFLLLLYGSLQPLAVYRSRRIMRMCVYVCVVRYRIMCTFVLRSTTFAAISLPIRHWQFSLITFWNKIDNTKVTTGHKKSDALGPYHDIQFALI